jgi:hypothetical protein
LTSYTRLHNHGHGDYELAKEHIHQMLGNIDEMELFGRQVLVAVYIRPQRNPVTGVYITQKEQTEDIHQGKAVLILKMGPDACKGDDGYVEATYGPNGPMKSGEWVFLAQQSGFPISLQGDGASRPQGPDFRGDMIDLYEWDGWPCRIVPDDMFIGRISNPTSVV